ncbi:MAG: HAMP domain-containing protein [Anaerolineales bacterium]|nr:HAMP domain-containing protein [Anaerolineales bacterium]
MRFGLQGLPTKIIAWFLVPTAIILSIVAFVTFRTYQQVTQDLVIERNHELTRLLASQLAADLSEYATQLSALAATADVYPLRSDPLTRKAIIRLSEDRLWDFDGGVVILDGTGTVVAADQRLINAVGEDWSDRAYFRAARQTSSSLPQPVFSDIGADGPSGELSIAIGMPARSVDGDFLGMSAGLFRISAGPEVRNSAFYLGIFSKLREMGGDRVYLVDGNGRVVYHSEPWRIGENMASQQVVQRALVTGSGGLRTRNEDAEEIVASFATVPGTDWVIVTEERWDVLISPSVGYRKLLLVLLGMTVLVPAIVIAVGAIRITRPIKELTEAARQVAGGRFGQVIPVHSRDEIEELATQFNRMSARLEESYATLEQRVANRTRELATLNNIAAVVSRSLQLDEILHSALTRTVEIMEMDAGSAYRLDERTSTLTLITHVGLSERFGRTAAHLPLSQSAAAESTRVGYPIVVPISDYAESELKEVLQDEGLQMAVSVPLMSKGHPVGALSLASRTWREVTADELSLLAAIGQQVGLAVENARLYEQAEETAVTAERHRLARDLHDAVTQTLFSASMIADVLPRLWERNPQEGYRRLEELRQLTRGALAEMRTLLVELRPSALAEAPLADLLRQLSEAMMARTRLPVDLTLNVDCDLPPDVKVAFYRIAQEALNNTYKHAVAEHVALTLRCTRDKHDQPVAELRICDDGRGFDPTAVGPTHLGLGIMRERAEAVSAELQVESAPGEGTEIAVQWQGKPNSPLAM